MIGFNQRWRDAGCRSWPSFHAFLNEADRERVAVEEVFGGLDRRDNRQDGIHDEERPSDQEAHADKTERDDHEAVDQEGEVKVQRLLGVGGHKGGVLFHHQVDDERQEKRNAKKAREVAEHAPEPIIAGDGGKGRGIHCEERRWVVGVK